MKPADLRTLHALCEQKRARDMAALTESRRRIIGFDTALSALAVQVRDQNSTFDTADLAVTARWFGWAGQEQTRLLRARAAQQSAIETARQIAAKSQAKTRVIADLVTKAEYLELVEQRRKAEQMGQEPDR